MVFTDDDLEEIVDELTKEKFAHFCKEGYNSSRLDAIRERVKEELLKEKDSNKCRAELILQERLKLPAIYHNEKILYDASLASEKVEKQQVEVDGSGTDNVKYFNFLSEYKKDDDLCSRVNGLEMRGKRYKVSKDGSCPSCNYKANVFVILDFLFPSGEDMPEMLTYLLGQGKAILWSSKQNLKYKDPPTFLCNGKCPFSDVMRCGFNIDWSTTDLEKIFLFPEQNYKPPEKKVKKNTVLEETKDTCATDENGDDVDDDDDDDDDDSEFEIYDEGHVDIDHYRNIVSWFVIDEYMLDESEIAADEISMIRTMLALEEARADFVKGSMKRLGFFYSDSETINTEEESGTEEDSSKEDIAEISVTTTGENTKTVSPPVGFDTHPVITITDGHGSSDSMDVEIYDLDEDGKAKEQSERKHTAEGRSAKTSSDPTLDSVFVCAQKTVDSVDLTGASNETTASKVPEFTAADFPVSTNGACPYCLSTDVVYIILKEAHSQGKLPALLEKLRSQGRAEIRAKGEYDLPSFQCRSCTYGFNLDWSTTNLEAIFSDSEISEATTSTFSTTPTSSISTQYTQQQQHAYQNAFLQSMPYYANPWGVPMPMAWPPMPTLPPQTVLPQVNAAVATVSPQMNATLPPTIVRLPPGTLPPVGMVPPVAMPPFYPQLYQWNQWRYPPPPPSIQVAPVQTPAVQIPSVQAATVSHGVTAQFSQELVAHVVGATEIIEIDMDTDGSGTMTGMGEVEEKITPVVQSDAVVIDLTENGNVIDNASVSQSDGGSDEPVPISEIKKEENVSEHDHKKTGDSEPNNKTVDVTTPNSNANSQNVAIDDDLATVEKEPLKADDTPATNNDLVVTNELASPIVDTSEQLVCDEPQSMRPVNETNEGNNTCMNDNITCSETDTDGTEINQVQPFPQSDSVSIHSTAEHQTSEDSRISDEKAPEIVTEQQEPKNKNDVINSSHTTVSNELKRPAESHVTELCDLKQRRLDDDNGDTLKPAAAAVTEVSIIDPTTNNVDGGITGTSLDQILTGDTAGILASPCPSEKLFNLVGETLDDSSPFTDSLVNICSKPAAESIKQATTEDVTELVENGVKGDNSVGISTEDGEDHVDNHIDANKNLTGEDITENVESDATTLDFSPSVVEETPSIKDEELVSIESMSPKQSGRGRGRGRARGRARGNRRKKPHL